MSDHLTDRLPPHNQEAERGVLGGILRDPDELATVQQIIRAENFYFDAHQKIFPAISELADEHQPLDLVMLHERLKKNKQLEDVGGADYLGDLWNAVPTGANAEYHAKIVRDTAMVRSLIHAGTEILRDSYDRTQSADELVAQAERKIMDIAKAGMVGETLTLEPGDPRGLGPARRRASETTTSPSAAWRPATSISTTFSRACRTRNS